MNDLILLAISIAIPLSVAGIVFLVMRPFIRSMDIAQKNYNEAIKLRTLYFKALNERVKEAVMSNFTYGKAK